MITLATIINAGKFINCSSDSDNLGRTISDTKHIHSRPRPRVSSGGRLLKPIPKLLQLPNATDAPAKATKKASFKCHYRRGNIHALDTCRRG